jgi:hypothetical protein
MLWDSQKGTSVKNRDGRAAVERLFRYQSEIRETVCPTVRQGRGFEVRCKSENLPVVSCAYISVLAIWDTVQFF